MGPQIKWGKIRPDFRKELRDNYVNFWHKSQVLSAIRNSLTAA